VLDAAGRGTSGRDRIRVGRGAPARVLVRLRGGLAEHLAHEGLTPGHVALEARTIAIRLEIGGGRFDEAQLFAYRPTPRRAHARDV
jgi:hypothetical protein